MQSSPAKKKRKIMYYSSSPPSYFLPEDYLPGEVWELIGMYLFTLKDRVHAILTSETHQLSQQLRRNHKKYIINAMKALFIENLTKGPFDIRPQALFLLDEFYTAMAEGGTTKRKAVCLRNLLSICIAMNFKVFTTVKDINVIRTSNHRYMIHVGEGTYYLLHHRTTTPSICSISICHVGNHMCLTTLRFFSADPLIEDNNDADENHKSTAMQKKVHAYLVAICRGLGINRPFFFGINLTVDGILNKIARSSGSLFLSRRHLNPKVCKNCTPELFSQEY